MTAAADEPLEEPVAVALPEAARSLKANVVSNYASQIFVALAGLVAMPFFLGRMGAEAYGLIGFFTLMNAWFQILDAGLSLTLARECARYRAGAIDAPALRALLRTLELLFFGVAALGAVAIAAAAPLIASHWLKVRELPLRQVTAAVLLMGLTVPLQWVTGLYRGAFVGFERQVWLSVFNAGMAAMRFGGGALVVALLGTSPVVFFSYQLAVSILELAILYAAAARMMPPLGASRRRLLTAEETVAVLRISGALAVAVVAWVLVNQVDKLVLSKVLPLADYGVYTLAVAAAGGVSMLGAPLGQALLPRLANRAASGAEADLVSLYRQGTQVACAVALPAGVVLAVFARQVLWAWTGNPSASAAAAPILTPYALGSGLMIAGAFPYYLQYAKGDLRLHVIGNLIFVVVLVPILAWAAGRFGAVGAGWAWFGLNLLYLIAWTPLVHRRLAPGLHWRWLVLDAAPPAAAAIAACLLLSRLFTWPSDRLTTIALLGLVSAFVLAAAASASPACRAFARAAFARLAPVLRA